MEEEPVPLIDSAEEEESEEMEEEPTPFDNSAEEEELEEMEIEQEEPKDTVEAATQEPSSPVEPIDEGIMDIGDEVDTVLQSSNFINEAQ